MLFYVKNLTWFEVLSGGYEELCLLRYNAKYSAESQPTFRRNILPQSPGSKNKPKKKPA
jgi:hypothetical protein